MSQTLANERTEVLQEVCSDECPLERAEAIFSRYCVVMDEKGNLHDKDNVRRKEMMMRFRKQLVLGTTDKWDQHPLPVANDILESVPDDLDDPAEIESFINHQL